MLEKNQTQKVTDGSTAIQAAGNISISQNGMSYMEVREIALDVFRANFFQLVGPAMETAKARAEEITEDFLRKLQSENPTGLEKGQNPDFQHALFTVQKEYARTGDKDLGDLLVDLLVDRSKQDKRDILQIVLNESLKTAPKLTSEQCAALSLIFLFKYTAPTRFTGYYPLANFLNTYVGLFHNQMTITEPGYQHLEFAGCGRTQLNYISLEGVLETNYQGFFLKGFDSAEVANRGVSVDAYLKFFGPCLNDILKTQVLATNKKSLEAALDAAKVSVEDRAQILELFDFGKFSAPEIKSKCLEVCPFMEKVFEVWNTSPMNSFTLTSVGMAIGHANIKRLLGEFASLEIWIN